MFLGEIGCIEYKWFRIVVGAYGDRRVDEVIDGQYFYYKNKENCYAFRDGGTDRIKDDSHLYMLCKSSEENNYLKFIENNWFEAGLINSNRKWIDLCSCDNVFGDNLLDCFNDIESYFDYVQWAVRDKIQ